MMLATLVPPKTSQSVLLSRRRSCRRPLRPVLRVGVRRHVRDHALAASRKAEVDLPTGLWLVGAATAAGLVPDRLGLPWGLLVVCVSVVPPTAVT